MARIAGPLGQHHRRRRQLFRPRRGRRQLVRDLRNAERPAPVYPVKVALHGVTETGNASIGASSVRRAAGLSLN